MLGSVVGVLIFSHFFLHDPANAEKRAQFGKILRGSTHACILREPEICFLTEFDQRISDMTAVIVLKLKTILRSSFLII